MYATKLRVIPEQQELSNALGLVSRQYHPTRMLCARSAATL
jgi:hypothetical protein